MVSQITAEPLRGGQSGSFSGMKWSIVIASTAKTYLPMRLENFPRDLLENFKNFFKSDEKTEEVDDEDP